MVLRKITIDKLLDVFPKLEKKQKKEILNQKQQKLVHFLVNKTKKVH